MATSEHEAEATAQVIRRALAGAGISHADAAKHLGIPLGTLRLRLYGRTTFAVAEMEAVAAMCHVALSDLVARIERMAGGEAA